MRVLQSSSLPTREDHFGPYGGHWNREHLSRARIPPGVVVGVQRGLEGRPVGPVECAIYEQLLPGGTVDHVVGEYRVLRDKVIRLLGFPVRDGDAAGLTDQQKLSGAIVESVAGQSGVF